MIVTINNAQLEYINCDFYAVYVKIPDNLYEVITKRLPLSTVKDDKFGIIFARTTIIPHDVYRYRGTDITFSVEKFLGSDTYVLTPVTYKRKNEGIIHDERRLSKVYHEALKSIREYGRRNSMFGIKNVIYHDPATIVYWCDGTKTVVECGENDIYDKEKGLAMCFAKRALGNMGNYYNTIKKWL